MPPIRASFSASPFISVLPKNDEALLSYLRKFVSCGSYRVGGNVGEGAAALDLGNDLYTEGACVALVPHSPQECGHIQRTLAAEAAMVEGVLKQVTTDLGIGVVNLDVVHESRRDRGDFTVGNAPTREMPDIEQQAAVRPGRSRDDGDRRLQIGDVAPGPAPPYRSAPTCRSRA
jgi:hypothetical protein